MSASGSSMMYPQQMMAYSSRNAHLGATTDSTETTPPSISKPNIPALCELKKSVIANLPTNCSHCGSAFVPRSIIERKTGEIVAYCKAPGACGKSLVLFAGVDLSYPVYQKYCPFKMKESEVKISHETPSPSSWNIWPRMSRSAETSVSANVSIAAPEQSPEPAAVQSTVAVDLPAPDTSSDSSPADMPVASNTDFVLSVASSANHLPLTADGELDVYALHGITRPDEKCALCGCAYSSHQTDCDQHGWKEVRRSHYSLPADWPTYNTDACTWSSRSPLLASVQ